MSVRRTGRGSLELGDALPSLERSLGGLVLIVARGIASIRFTAIDRDADQRVELHLGTDELNALAAEILTRREEMDI